MRTKQIGETHSNQQEQGSTPSPYGEERTNGETKANHACQEQREEKATKCFGPRKYKTDLTPLSTLDQFFLRYSVHSPPFAEIRFVFVGKRASTAKCLYRSRSDPTGKSANGSLRFASHFPFKP